MPPVVATIAGSDPSGGAGIQADLRTFAALGAYGTSVVTAVTAQDPGGVYEVLLLSPASVTAQLSAVTGAFRHAAVKIGMLGDGGIVRAVSSGLACFGEVPVVLDPVLRSTSGRALLDPEGQALMAAELLPRAYLITPNLAEAALLTGETVVSVEGMRRAARCLHAMGPRYVLVKGGHLDGTRVVDILFDGRTVEELERERIPASPHGTGCVLSAAITAHLAEGQGIGEAVGNGIRFTAEAIRGALEGLKGSVCALGPRVR
jgi:hydroxymethylpyrimidine/phosphomethylpyrimidine kinase